MADLAFDDPCILFALRRESQPFLREFRPQQRFPGAPCWARFCGPAWLSVLVLQTGIGRAGTETALNWLMDQPVMGGVPYRPKVILCAGFSGALQEGLQVGDVILATDVTVKEGRSWPATWPGELPPGEWRPPLHRGRLLSVPSLISRPEQKKTLGQEQQALAADMEAAAVAGLCSQHGVPFGCVRAISDDVHTPLPAQLVSLLSGGRVSLLRTLTAVLSSPGLAAEFPHLAKRTGFAAKQLGKALGELLTLTLPWAANL